MQELVFIESEDLNCEPFTTDEVIAEFSGNNRDSVTRLIRNYQDDLKSLGSSDLKSDLCQAVKSKSIPSQSAASNFADNLP